MVIDFPYKLFLHCRIIIYNSLFLQLKRNLKLFSKISYTFQNLEWILNIKPKIGIIFNRFCVRYNFRACRVH